MSNYIIPLIVLIIVVYGIFKKVDVYDTFVDGACESFPLVLKMFPCLLGMIFAINIFLGSQLIFDIFKIVSFIPNQIIPLIILRPLSGTASLSVLTNIYETLGPDSLAGLIGSLIQGGTDTTFYVLTLYFGSIGIKKIRYALFVGLMADITAIVISIIVCNLIF